MPGATLPSTDAVANWTDNTDNWRSVDADFLQKRSILRFTDATSRNNALGPSSALPAPAQGQVTYVANGGVSGSGGLEFIDATGSWRSVLSVNNLGLEDSSGAFGLRLSSDSTSVVSLETDKVVLGKNRILSVETSKLVFKTGATTVELSTNADSLVSNTKITAPSLAVGAISASTLTASGAISGSSLGITGAASLDSLVVSGTSNLGTTATVSTLSATAGVSAVTVHGTSSVRGGSVLMSTTRVANNGAANQYLEVGPGTTTVGGDSVVLAPSAATSAVRFGSVSGAPFALVVVSANDPGLSNYPDGTIWVQP